MLSEPLIGSSVCYPLCLLQKRREKKFHMFQDITLDQKAVLKPLTDAAFVFFPLSFLGLHLQMF